MGGRQAFGVCRPVPGQIQGPVDEGMSPERDIGGKDTDLAKGDLAGRAGVLASNATRGAALLEKAHLVQNQNGFVVGLLLEHIVANEIAQGIGLPAAAPQNGLLSPSCPQRPKTVAPLPLTSST